MAAVVEFILHFLLELGMTLIADKLCGRFARTSGPF